MYDLLLGVVGIGSLAGLLWVIRRKLAMISSIDVDSLPQQQASQVKGQLLEARFSRSVQQASHWMTRQWQPILRNVKQQYGSVGTRLRELEKRYSFPGGGATPDEAKAQIIKLLAQAKAYIEDEQWADAERTCLEIIGLQKLEPTAYRLLGEIYWERREYGQAKEVYEFLLKLNEQDPEAHVGLGRVAVAQGALAEAEAEFTKSLEASDTAAVHLDLADVYERLGQPDKALIATQDALTLEPRNPKILDRFFGLALAQNKLDLARDAFTRLREVNPENQKLGDLAEQLASRQHSR